jgi:hypothetical protein
LKKDGVVDGKGVEMFVIQEEERPRSVDGVRKMRSRKEDGVKEMMKVGYGGHCTSWHRTLLS